MLRSIRGPRACIHKVRRRGCRVGEPDVSVTRRKGEGKMTEQVIVGIDVSADSLDVAVEVSGEEFTGVYSFDLALALHKCEHAEVMVANPRSIKDFARASMKRSKSDAQDAVSIREFAKRMDFVPWQPPAREVLELRTITRRIAALTVERTRELNRKHAAAPFPLAAAASRPRPSVSTPRARTAAAWRSRVDPPRCSSTRRYPSKDRRARVSRHRSTR